MGNRKDVRILLVGEPGVGKTSLILSLVSEEFPEEVPARAEEIVIPADVTPERVPTHIVDYCAQEQGKAGLEEEVRRANVVCIVYAVDRDDTIEQITGFWLPYLRARLGERHSTPVVLVGNKADLSDYSSLEIVLPIMAQYPEVETCVECSAKTLKNISELFYYAQKAVLHPIAPLYVTETRSLTDKCTKALARIFKICDHDNDGILNDSELNAFQKRCFNSPLQWSALTDVKNIVKRNVPNGILNNGLTLEGFLFLHTLFIQRGRHETTWTVLRKFGYSDTVTLRRDYVFPQIHLPMGSSTEMSPRGYEFFKIMFEKYDMDKDGLLSPKEVQDMFSICPSVPWGPELPNMVEASVDGWITQNGFICYWVLTTLLTVQRTLEYLAYLGYIENPDEPQTTAIVVNREKKIDQQKQQTNRNVFLCQVIGPQGAGKTSLMQAFLGRTLEKQEEYIYKFPPSDYSVNTVQVYGKPIYLVLHEIDLFTLNTTISTLDRYSDVVCLVYDTTYSKSFEYIAKIFKKSFASLECKVPAMIVATKSDEQAVSQLYPCQPSEFCAKHKLSPPQSFTAHFQIRRNVFIKLGCLAVHPYFKQVPGLTQVGSIGSWIQAGLSLTTLALISLLLVKLLHSSHRRS